MAPTTHTPTERLVKLILAAAPKPMSLADLTVAVGSTPSTMLKITTQLVRTGDIHRERINGVTHYTITGPEVQP